MGLFKFFVRVKFQRNILCVIVLKGNAWTAYVSFMQNWVYLKMIFSVKILTERVRVKLETRD